MSGVAVPVGEGPIAADLDASTWIELVPITHRVLLDPDEWQVVSACQGPTAPGQLAARTTIDAAALSAAVGRLVGRGLAGVSVGPMVAAERDPAAAGPGRVPPAPLVFAPPTVAPAARFAAPTVAPAARLAPPAPPPAPVLAPVPDPPAREPRGGPSASTAMPADAPGGLPRRGARPVGAPPPTAPERPRAATPVAAPAPAPVAPSAARPAASDARPPWDGQWTRFERRLARLEERARRQQRAAEGAASPEAPVDASEQRSAALLRLVRAVQRDDRPR